jgi:hypothetical protein
MDMLTGETFSIVTTVMNVMATLFVIAVDSNGLSVALNELHPGVPGPGDTSHVA